MGPEVRSHWLCSERREVERRRVCVERASRPLKVITDGSTAVIIDREANTMESVPVSLAPRVLKDKRWVQEIFRQLAQQKLEHSLGCLAALQGVVMRLIAILNAALQLVEFLIARPLTISFRDWSPAPEPIEVGTPIHAPPARATFMLWKWCATGIPAISM